MQEFKVGDAVTWNSQAQGFITQKSGVIVEVVPAGENPPLFKYNDTHKSQYGGGMPRNTVSYLVETRRAGSKALPKIYWPRTSALRLAA